MITGSFEQSPDEIIHMGAPMAKPEWAKPLMTPNALLEAIRPQVDKITMHVRGRSGRLPGSSMSMNCFTFTHLDTAYRVIFFTRRAEGRVSRRESWFARDVVAGKHDKAKP